MKKPLLILFLAVIFLTSCAVKPAEPELKFRKRIKASFNSTKITAEISSDSHKLLTITLKSQMKGCVYAYRDGKIKITYMNLFVSAEDNYLPDSAFPQKIYNVYKRLRLGKYELKRANNSFAEYKGESESGGFILRTDIKTGEPIELSVSDNLNIKFE